MKGKKTVLILIAVIASAICSFILFVVTGIADTPSNILKVILFSVCFPLVMGGIAAAVGLIYKNRKFK